MTTLPPRRPGIEAAPSTKSSWISIPPRDVKVPWRAKPRARACLARVAIGCSISALTRAGVSRQPEGGRDLDLSAGRGVPAPQAPRSLRWPDRPKARRRRSSGSTVRKRCDPAHRIVQSGETPRLTWTARDACPGASLSPRDRIICSGWHDHAAGRSAPVRAAVRQRAYSYGPSWSAGCLRGGRTPRATSTPSKNETKACT